MVFDREKCVIRKIYCGNGQVPGDTRTKKYSRAGTRPECMRRGFGVADWTWRKKDLPETSLQQIPYIGPIYNDRFAETGIYSITELVPIMSEMTRAQKRELLEVVLLNKANMVDRRAYNSVLAFLDDRGVCNLPTCVIVRE